MWKHIVLISTIILLFLIVISRCGVGVSTDYPLSVMWNDTLYLDSGEFLSENEVGENLGSISKKVRNMPDKNGEAHGIIADSNIFEIKDFSTNKSIAIEEEQGKFRIFTSDDE